MNKKRNGFTLVELLVCFVLITIVTISLFKTVLTLQQKQQKKILQKAKQIAHQANLKKQWKMRRKK